MVDLNTPVPGVELIVGGQKSGKSRRAECLANRWLTAPVVNGVPRQATLIATATAWDAEMQQCIARHRADRAQRAPALATLEEPLALAQAIANLSAPHHLLVVDCLTLWLTNWLMPPEPTQADSGVTGHSAHPGQPDTPHTFSEADVVKPLLDALARAPGPVVLVTNEIGLGVIPMGAQVRHFVYAMGQVNQAVATVSQRAVLMVAGLPCLLKAEQ